MMPPSLARLPLTITIARVFRDRRLRAGRISVSAGRRVTGKARSSVVPAAVSTSPSSIGCEPFQHGPCAAARLQLFDRGVAVRAYGDQDRHLTRGVFESLVDVDIDMGFDRDRLQMLDAVDRARHRQHRHWPHSRTRPVVMIRRGRRSSSTISTMRLPEAIACAVNMRRSLASTGVLSPAATCRALRRRYAWSSRCPCPSRRPGHGWRPRSSP